MPKRVPGLYKRYSKDQETYVWEIDKQIGGKRIRRSTGTSDYTEAQRQLAREIECARQRDVYGVTEPRTFLQGATRYLKENGHKRDLNRDATAIDFFLPYIGSLPLHLVHMGTLDTAIDARQAQVSASTINRDLFVIRRILTLAARLWRDELGRPWLQTIPLIPVRPTPDKRKPYPLTWDEQRLLFGYLTGLIHDMALFVVNTGARDKEARLLQWQWESRIDGNSVFVLPGEYTKNGRDRILVCNRVAQSIVNSQREKHERWVFPSARRRADGSVGPVTSIRNSAWKTARENAAEAYANEIGGSCPRDFARVRVHDLRHTFGRRLRAAGVSEEDRADLLGHTTQSMPTWYAQAEIDHLVNAANKACDGVSRPLLRVVT